MAASTFRNPNPVIKHKNTAFYNATRAQKHFGQQRFISNNQQRPFQQRAQKFVDYREHNRGHHQNPAPRHIFGNNDYFERNRFQQNWDFKRNNQFSNISSHREATHHNIEPGTFARDWRSKKQSSNHHPSKIKPTRRPNGTPSNVVHPPCNQHSGGKTPQQFRARNIIIHGLDFTKGEPQVCVENLLNLLNVEYNIVHLKVLKNVNRTKSTCLVTLKTVEQKGEIFKNVGKLKRSYLNVHIGCDLTPEEREFQKLSNRNKFEKRNTLKHKTLKPFNDAEKAIINGKNRNWNGMQDEKVEKRSDRNEKILQSTKQIDGGTEKMF